MSLQTGLPNRRKFLERSVLGADSVLFLPGLLTGCTDHIIPDTDIPWPSIDTDIDWNDDAKIVVTTGLEMIPEVGEILGGLVDIFWPGTQEDVWGEVKAQVEALINQRISDLVYQQVSEDLQGLNNSITLYLNELKTGDPVSIKTQWIVTRNLFAQALPHFQSTGYEVLLLPLFAQFANLYLSILRDAVAFGKSWGRNDAEQRQSVTDLKKSIQDFSGYTSDTYYIGLSHVAVNAPVNARQCEPFRTVNTFERQMTLTVLDFMNTWAYYDVTQYPNGAKVVLTREIYSDPMGTCNNTGILAQDVDIIIPKPAPTKPPTQLTVWGGDRVDAVQVTYPQGSGPAGVTQTDRMGYPTGSSNQPPRGGSFTISPDNPITMVRARTGDIIDAIQFRFYDGTVTNVLGGNGVINAGDGGVPLYWGYRNELMSSVYGTGYSNFYYSINCIVIGFQYWQPPATTLKAIRNMYIKSPKERSMADFAKAFPNLALSAGLITDELKAARQAHWASVEARAKALK